MARAKKRARSEPDDDLGSRIEAARGELYAGPFEELTARRDALAREVKERDPALAREIRGIRKPTRIAWALDHVARARPDDVEALLTVSGGGKRKRGIATTGEVVAEHRERLDRVVEAVLRELEAGGMQSGPDVHRRVRSALSAIVFGEEQLREELMAGRLEREPEHAIDLDAALAVTEGTRGAEREERSARKDRSGGEGGRRRGFAPGFGALVLPRAPANEQHVEREGERRPRRAPEGRSQRDRGEAADAKWARPSRPSFADAVRATRAAKADATRRAKALREAKALVARADKAMRRARDLERDADRAAREADKAREAADRARAQAAKLHDRAEHAAERAMRS